MAQSSVLSSEVILLLLIRHFFDCGWLRVFALAVVAVVIFVVRGNAFIGGIAVIELGLGL
jgi:hypothetical protein